jgi:hypothetical protein
MRIKIETLTDTLITWELKLVFTMKIVGIHVIKFKDGTLNKIPATTLNC